MKSNNCELKPNRKLIFDNTLNIMRLKFWLNPDEQVLFEHIYQILKDLMCPMIFLKTSKSTEVYFLPLLSHHLHLISIQTIDYLMKKIA